MDSATSVRAPPPHRPVNKPLSARSLGWSRGG
jgi:hypothetical protein